jgi:hypothetical protein
MRACAWAERSVCCSALLPASQSGVRENVYVIKALLRVLVVAGCATFVLPRCEEVTVASNRSDAVLEHCTALAPRLVIALATVAQVTLWWCRRVRWHVASLQNPLNATFNHYLFESIAALIKVRDTASAAGAHCAWSSPQASVKASANAASAFEALLFAPLQTILVNDVTEFAPYAFQIFAQLLEATPTVRSMLTCARVRNAVCARVRTGECCVRTVAAAVAVGGAVGARWQCAWTGAYDVAAWRVTWQCATQVRLMQAYARRSPALLAAHIMPTLGAFQQVRCVQV